MIAHLVHSIISSRSRPGMVINQTQSITDTHSCCKDVLRFGSCWSVINRSDPRQMVQVGIPVDFLTIEHTEASFFC